MTRGLDRTLVAALFIGLVGCGDSAASAPDGGWMCVTDVDCDDGIYCNGVERCAPGTPPASPQGCVPGAAPCSAGCDETEDRCIEADCAIPDADGDGHDAIDCGGTDCDDSDPDRFPGNPERCDDRHDEDCDPLTVGPDADGDGYYDARCCNLVTTGSPVCGQDCNDGSSSVNPTAIDSCNLVDDDCDGNLDENPATVFYRDLDGDGFGIGGDPDDEDLDPAVRPVRSCGGGPGFALMAGDCDDLRGQVNPGNAEVCDAARLDENCNGEFNEGCACDPGDTVPCGLTDPSLDGVGLCRLGSQVCDSGTLSACIGAVPPRAEECGGGDEDCDGTIDEPDAIGAQLYYEDMDGDGFGSQTVFEWACAAPGGYVSAGGDCDDGNDEVKPGITDGCNSVDDDCDGSTDEDATTCDCDDGQTRPCGSDVGRCQRGTETCRGGSWSSCEGSVGPISEMCDFGSGESSDEDCDGQIDEDNAMGTSTFYRDADGDGYGDPSKATQLCALRSGYVEDATDCYDGSNLVRPPWVDRMGFHHDPPAQPVPYCTNGIDYTETCGCRQALGSACNTSGSAPDPSFDYNCDGSTTVVSPRDATMCWDSPLIAGVDCSIRERDDIFDASQCGDDVVYNICGPNRFLDCTLVRANGTVACR